MMKNLTKIKCGNVGMWERKIYLIRENKKYFYVFEKFGLFGLYI